MCGVFGIFGHPEAANMTYLGLHALQHRGQESAGIVTTDGEQLYAHRAMGLVQDAFTQDQLGQLPGRIAIGHVRYSTAGGSHIKNAQPIAVDYARGSLAVCHNGNLTNAEELRAELEARGLDLPERQRHRGVRPPRRAEQGDRARGPHRRRALAQVKGAYSLLFLTEDAIIAVRDPMGIRPLCLGTPAGREGRARRRERAVRLRPHRRRVRARRRAGRDARHRRAAACAACARSSRRRTRACIFEYVYFARPDSKLGGRSVYEVRKALRADARAASTPSTPTSSSRCPTRACPRPSATRPTRGVPFEMGLIRSHYVGRTFIEPQQSIRHFGVRLKLNPVEPVLRGKRVVVIDDSIVRGTTSRKIVKMVRDAGAREVHLRISSPPTQWPCYYGIDTPTRRELIASSHSVDEIARYVTADSLGFLSLEGMVAALGNEGSLLPRVLLGAVRHPLHAAEQAAHAARRRLGDQRTRPDTRYAPRGARWGL